MGINSKKNANKPRKINPFELKFNKSKHDVLGKKRKGTQVGAPTASRKRAHEHREKTLGVEYDRKNKISKIVDKRLGERDTEKSAEEKSALRFAEERVKNFKRSAKFNLGDDYEEEEEVLTHGGKALSDIEKYDKSMISDSDDDEDPGNLGAKMVKVAHFGGGEKSNEEKVMEKISREDMISNLIAKTKMARHEKQTAKDELELMTESLDAKYQSIMSKVQTSFRPPGRQQSEKDDFDKLAFTLKVEADLRATPAERKLTDEEMALREKEKLESLETARINAQLNANSHLSADVDVDIDAGVKADLRKKKMESSRFEVRFADDGGIVDKDKIEKASIQKIRIADGSDDEMDDEMEDEEEDLDDLMETDDELDDEEEEEEEEVKKPAKKVKKGADTSAVPFVFEMPKNYKKFCDLLEKYSNDMEVVLERIVKCNHPSLKEGNKAKLNKLFLLCLRWYDDMAREELNEQTVKEMNLAQKTMFELLKFDVQYGVRCVRALIRQHWKQRQDKEKSSPASFALIGLLRLTAALFPIADLWHPVCTPAFFLATNVICSAKIPNLRILARQILLAQTLVEFVVDSKKYVPELVSFAKSALLLAVAEKPEPFPTSGFPISKPFCEMLCNFAASTSKIELEPISLKLVFGDEEIGVKAEEKLRVSVFRSLVSLVQHLRVLYSSQNETYDILFRPFLAILTRIDKKNLPNEVKDELETLIASMSAECDAKKRITQLSVVKMEMSMMKMLEPRFEWDFDPERPYKGKANEKKRMQKELKNEMRGAVKELRKDTAFLARKQMKNVKSKDRARVNATKRLMGGLMQQQGEWNKEMRTKDVEVKKEKKK